MRREVTAVDARWCKRNKTGGEQKRYGEENLYPDSSDGKSKLSGFYSCRRDTPRCGTDLPRQCEYILRYEELAQHLTDAGYAVCGIDHLGARLHRPAE